MSSSGEKRKSGDDTINLVVKGQGMMTAHMNMNPNSQMRLLMSAYCKRVQQDLGTIQFLYGDDGLRVQMRDTPRKLGLSDGDELYALCHQHGGGLH